MKKAKKKVIIFIAAVGAFFLINFVFVGYRYGFGPLKSLNNIPMSKIPGNAPNYSMDNVSELEDSPFKDKKILFLGSSVTYGSASMQEGIPEYFRIRFGCEITKEAVSGTTLVDNGTRSYVQRLLKKVDTKENYDLVVVQLSTNDATNALPLGEIAGRKSLSEFDTRTITGAMEYIIAYARDTWGCPVAFYTNARYDSQEYAAMVTRLKELQAEWGICVMDLWTSDEFNTLSEEERALYMNDHIHPTKAGYRDWWCPEMERQLCDWLTAS